MSFAGRCAVAVAVLLALGPVAGAQETWPVLAGKEVRYRLIGSPTRFTGHVLQVHEDCLFVKPLGSEPMVQVPLSSLARLEFHQPGRRFAKEGALIGFVPGAIYGAKLFAGLTCWEQSNCSGGGSALVGGVVGGGLTAGLGALIGAAIHTGGWQTVPLRGAQLTVLPTRGGIGASITVGF